MQGSVSIGFAKTNIFMFVQFNHKSFASLRTIENWRTNYTNKWENPWWCCIILLARFYLLLIFHAFHMVSLFRNTVLSFFIWKTVDGLDISWASVRVQIRILFVSGQTYYRSTYRLLMKRFDTRNNLQLLTCRYSNKHEPTFDLYIGIYW